MISIEKKELAEMVKMDLLTEIYVLQSRVVFFENKYKCTLNEFEVKLKSDDEKYEAWDDFMEWKAYQNTLSEKQNEVKAIENEDFRLVG